MPSSADNLPSNVLRQEHQVILRVLSVLEKLLARFESGRDFEKVSFSRCVEFFRLFADACHHSKEEDLLFPVLESRGIPREGGPIGVMLQEHRMARKLTGEMKEALGKVQSGQTRAASDFCRSARNYIQLLRGHIFKEDNVLFRLGDKVMHPQDQEILCSRFGEAGCKAFSGKTREQLESIADELEERWVNFLDDPPQSERG